MPSTQTNIKMLNLFSALFSILLGICLVFSLIGIPLKRTILNPDFINQNLVKSGFYEQIPGSIASTISAQASSMIPLSQEQAVVLINAILPQGWVNQQTEQIINQAESFLNLESREISILVNLQPIKDNVYSEAGQQALISVINSLPTCSEEQLGQMIIGLQTGQPLIAVCSPIPSGLIPVEFVLVPVSAMVSNAIPESIQFPTEAQTETIKAWAASSDFQMYRIAREVINWAPWVSLFLFIMVIGSNFRSISKMMLWLGLPMIGAGLISAIPGLFAIVNGGQISNQVSMAGSQYGMGAFSGLIESVIRELIYSSGLSLLFWSVGAVFVGLILFVISLITKK